VRVDIWSDVVCPWCAIGAARFERALAQFDGPIQVRLHPFQLDPEAPVPGEPARRRYAKKFGDEAAAMLERVTEAASEEGLRFDFDRAITPNTFDAHRALGYARRDGADRVLEKALFTAYFSDGLDVSDRDVLERLATDAGCDGADLRRYLESDAGVEEVTNELNSAFDRGIRGVPTFIFEEEFVVPGAVDTATFLRILQQMSALSEST